MNFKFFTSISFLVSSSMLNAFTFNQALDYVEKFKKEYGKHYSYTEKDLHGNKKNGENENTYFLTNIQSNRNFAKKYINKNLCDKVVSNKVVTSCYNFNLKSVTKVSYVVDKTNVYKLNIKKRPNWHYNLKIPKKYRANNNDYVRSSFDKGHLAFDSAFDFNKKVLFDTFDLNINAVPMTKKVNRYTWRKLESYTKRIANNLGYLQVIDFIVFNKKGHIKTIGKNRISIPKGFYKILINKNENFLECYYYENKKNVNVRNDKLSDHNVKCKKVFNLMLRKL